MKTWLTFILPIIFALGSSACRQPMGIECKEEFRTVAIEISGLTVDSFLTIRLSTNDTIRNVGFLYENYYPVLTDNYQHKLENQTDSFLFLAWKADSLVVQEPFVIKADFCHIYKVSGKEKVSF
ncbi:MAG: hypothetical protein E6Q89_00835 [Bacteroidia bacterium]|nr:MAG: hypothetical protein E6Q89_00835 [Bacteroidia bacterium]